MMVSRKKLIVHFATAEPNIAVRQSKSLEDRDIGNNLRLFGKFRPTISKFSSLWEMAQVPLLSLQSTLHSQVLSIKDRRNGEGKPVLKLVSSGNGQLFALTAPDLCIPGIS